MFPFKKSYKSPFESPSNSHKIEPFSYKTCLSEALYPPNSSKIKPPMKNLKDSYIDDDIISMIAKKNLKNFLNYKRWKKSTTMQKNEKMAKYPSKLIENSSKLSTNSEHKSQTYEPITKSAYKINTNTHIYTFSNTYTKKQTNLKHIYKKMLTNKHILTKSLTDMQKLLNKNNFSRTFSTEFPKNNKYIKTQENIETHKIALPKKKNEKKMKEMNKLAEIVTKVKNFKVNFSKNDENMQNIYKLLESVKGLSLDKYGEDMKKLKNIDKQQNKPVLLQKKFLLESSKNQHILKKKPVLSIKLMKNQRKSLENMKNEENIPKSVKIHRELSPDDKKAENTFVYYMSLLDYFIRNPNDNDYFNLLYREHFLQSLAAYNYCIGLKRNNEVNEEKKVYLGENKNNLKTLVFDLDETLVHCNEISEIVSDIKIQVKINETETITAGVNIRPYALEILRDLKEKFEIVIFTASHSSYANTVLDFIDPDKILIKKRLFRENCLQTEQGIFIKDLKIFVDRKPENIILVDNALYSFAYQIDNGIPIIPFYDNKQDKELMSLKMYLESLYFSKDFREINKKTFKFKQYDKFENIEELLNNLFQGLEFEI